MSAEKQTAITLIEKARATGAIVWLESRGRNLCLRHLGAGRAVMKQLRSLSREVLIAAFENERQQVAVIQRWLIGETVPGTAFSGSVEHFHRDCGRWSECHSESAQSEAVFTRVLKYRTGDEFVTGVCLREDFLAELQYEQERAAERSCRGYAKDPAEELTLPCSVHGDHRDWWIRILCDGGEMVCGRCHPNPEARLSPARPQGGHRALVEDQIASSVPSATLSSTSQVKEISELASACASVQDVEDI